MFSCCKISLEIIICCLFILPYETRESCRSEVFTCTVVVVHVFLNNWTCCERVWSAKRHGFYECDRAERGGIVLFRSCAAHGWRRRKSLKRTADIRSFSIRMFRVTFMICELQPIGTRRKGQFEFVDFNLFVLSVPIQTINGQTTITITAYTRYDYCTVWYFLLLLYKSLTLLTVPIKLVRPSRSIESIEFADSSTTLIDFFSPCPVINVQGPSIRSFSG